MKVKNDVGLKSTYQCGEAKQVTWVWGKIECGCARIRLHVGLFVRGHEG